MTKQPYDFDVKWETDGLYFFYQGEWRQFKLKSEHQMGEEDMLERVIEWLRENLNRREYEGYLRYLGRYAHLRAIIDQEKVISDLTKAMNPQQQEEQLMKAPRIKVKEKRIWHEASFVGDIEALVNDLQDLQAEGWVGIQMADCYSGGPPAYELFKWRLENDEEYEARMEKEDEHEAAKARAKEKRRLKYEELKKEFEQS